MHTRVLQYILWSAGLLALLTGLGLTVRTTSRLSLLSQDRRAQQDALNTLTQLAERLKPGLAARLAFEESARDAAPSFETIMKQAVPGTAPADVRELTPDTGNEWGTVQKEVTFRNVGLAAVIPLVEQAERQRPPWRLVKCILQAAPGTPGNGLAVLRFETLQRKP